MYMVLLIVLCALGAFLVRGPRFFFNSEKNLSHYLLDNFLSNIISVLSICSFSVNSPCILNMFFHSSLSLRAVLGKVSSVLYFC